MHRELGRLQRLPHDLPNATLVGQRLGLRQHCRPHQVAEHHRELAALCVGSGAEDAVGTVGSRPQLWQCRLRQRLAAATAELVAWIIDERALGTTDRQSLPAGRAELLSGIVRDLAPGTLRPVTLQRARTGESRKSAPKVALVQLAVENGVDNTCGLAHHASLVLHAKSCTSRPRGSAEAPGCSLLSDPPQQQRRRHGRRSRATGPDGSRECPGCAFDILHPDPRRASHDDDHDQRRHADLLQGLGNGTARRLFATTLLPLFSSR